MRLCRRDVGGAPTRRGRWRGRRGRGLHGAREPAHFMNLAFPWPACYSLASSLSESRAQKGRTSTLIKPCSNLNCTCSEPGSLPMSGGGWNEHSSSRQPSARPPAVTFPGPTSSTSNLNSLRLECASVNLRPSRFLHAAAGGHPAATGKHLRVSNLGWRRAAAFRPGVRPSQGTRPLTWCHATSFGGLGLGSIGCHRGIRAKPICESL